EDALNAFVQRRAAAGSALATGRRESDLATVLSGVCGGVTTGQPLTAIFENADTHSSDYGFLPDRPRPGHADYPALVKSAGCDDLRGSGHHSGRLTLPYVYAGGIAM
ncbi:MAG: chorismate synthase, partial [Clostridia bacterium]